MNSNGLLKEEKDDMVISVSHFNVSLKQLSFSLGCCCLILVFCVS